MAHVLLLMVAGLMSGMVGNLSPFGPLNPVLLGVSLAAYLLLRAGVDSPSRLGLVVAAAVAGYYVMIIGGFAGLMVLLMLRDYAPRSIELAAAPGAAVGAGVVALAFLSVLPSQRDHLKLEVACCAILVSMARGDNRLEWCSRHVTRARGVLANAIGRIECNGASDRVGGRTCGCLHAVLDWRPSACRA